ncbi:23S rRNA (uracil(1939)-C(5))-methyltransferase RlmD [Xenorhabdus nematophila]|uniref:23S rRNA (uracil(1939)-C(5))-methyltransferase RlmD n=1 Tax=Xenorhabdus nematophila TaxID=628 RepID=UPI00054197AC|nr:23S rRNA (uracil(1939)-C(5))-methyltransferase RlmD [Xenorhabdus nematophila]CEF29340.1 23S rRNA m5U1939 methyltransferase [Xenorhabdus nematophila str. Websteri]AYA42506.1 23S rRNA (uracil(1939)-C(5))-methyltransferase RlmD [Xenorhabdus nematophila]MBA0019789.1 23S rRNA (uracil(1939)-C(5))-methyltransferase RlmD [Xenorhabdus nematophila]MCB4425378.1 23S rRNA (uracil(1939)-C(5))-methyltransferase RlmD [Xenorhabdus nematophila]QNJ38394.1 23S rRNA (uracil(1939)-C(5))-methyltransferase RlmD [X
MVQFYSPNRRSVNRGIISVTADNLDAQGQGIARHQGKTIFISGLLPGEQAQIQLTEEKRQFAKARVVKRLSDSPYRVAPRCPHFKACGGCQQQHIATGLQVNTKASVLEHLIQRETGIKMSAYPIIQSPEYGYRRRARLGLQYNVKQRTLLMGFRQNQTNDLINIKRCPVMRPELEQLLQPLFQCLNGLNAVKRLGHVELVLADNGPLIILRHLDPLKHEDRAALSIFSVQYNVKVYLAGDEKSLESLTKGQAEPWYQVDGLKLVFSPRDFIQVNDEVNQQMVAQALMWLDLQPTDRVLDLFCGMGNFTLPMATKVQAVVGVEGVAALVSSGQYNARLNELKNVDFFHENLESDIHQQPWAALGFNKVLLDPARAGAAGVMSHIVKLAPDKVVYVSCNPTTLARDSKVMLEAGYHLVSVRMLDMFPHTGHLESMALFSREIMASRGPMAIE